MRQILVLALGVLASIPLTPVLQQPKGPPRPQNKLIVSGTVHTAYHQPVPGARIVANLIRVEQSDPAVTCPPRQGSLREAKAETSPSGQFEVLFQSAGPQFDACLVLKVLAPTGSGLKDTVVSGQRVRFQLPDPRTHQILTVPIDVVLRQ